MKTLLVRTNVAGKLEDSEFKPSVLADSHLVKNCIEILLETNESVILKDGAWTLEYCHAQESQEEFRRNFAISV